jgi:hypothetical protein
MYLSTSSLIHTNHHNLGDFALFLQSDVRVLNASNEVLMYIDKSFLLQSAASKFPNVELMFHKITTLADNLIHKSTGRPTYSHLLCFGKNASYMNPCFPAPDVFYRG